MKTPARFPCLPALLAALLTIGIVARGQDNNPTPPPAAPDAAQAQTAAPADATPAADAKTPPEKSELRRLDAEPAKTDAPSRPQAESSPAADQAAAAAPTPATPPVPEEATPPDHHKRPRVHHAHNGDNERVNFGGNSTLAAGESADAVISIFGSSTAEGDVGDAVVSVFGNSTSSGKVGNAVVSVLGSTHVAGGEVGDAAVSVLGTTTIDGQVHGPAVAVLGDVVLGPNASVGDVVCVGGTLKRDPAATVHGQINNVGFGVSFGGFDWLHAWVQHCLILGRPLAFGAHLMWAWWLALTMLALYVVIALLFPKGVEKCVRTFEERPGYSLLSALLVTLLTPLAAIVLLVTVVGTPALVLFLVIAGIFGKVVILAWMGRRVLKLFQQDAPAAALAVVVGGALLLLLYTVPFVGFIVAKLTSWVGLGAVVYTIILGMKRPKPPAPQPVRATPAASVAAAAAPSIAVPPTTAGGDVVSSAPVAPTPDTPLQSAGFGAPVPEVPPGTVPPPVSAAAAVPPPVVVSASTLTRAGFWIRIAASFLDAIIVGLAINLLPNRWEPHFLLAFAAYCCVLWALRSTTIGGIICNLKVVRLDDRPLDWPTALVRTLGGFVSLIAVGLGFIWVAFDDQKQSWHDKIAGTTVVVVPKGVSLV